VGTVGADRDPVARRFARVALERELAHRLGEREAVARRVELDLKAEVVGHGRRS
jgi:hypothetical protein